jgi:hypothetical protein
MIAKGSFEDFLYIFIGLVWIGFSIYKAQQKKKAAAPGQGNVKKEKSFIDKLVSEFLTDEPSNPYHIPSSQENQVEPNERREDQPKKVFSYDDLYEESNAMTDFDVYEKTPVIKAEIADEIKSKQQPKKRKPRIDLRKAVIYSEILNRKYT